MRLDEINSLDLFEVYARYELAKQAEGVARYHAVRAAVFAQSGEKAQRVYLGEIRREMTFELQLREDVLFSVQDPQTRLRMIGCNLQLGGMQYLAEHPDHAQWLVENGFTAEQAVSEYARWDAEKFNQVKWKRVIPREFNSFVQQRLDKYKRQWAFRGVANK